MSESNPNPSSSACAVCLGAFGPVEVYFRAEVEGRDRRVCPRCLHILIHGMSIADARRRMGVTSADPED